MQNKRDQLRAYLFVVHRVKAAVLRANPDAASLPFRRTTPSTFAGIIICALVTGVCVVIGLIFPGGSTAWAKPGVIVVAKENGARYVTVLGVLHPVLNFTSARLAIGKPGEVVTVSERSLDGVPRGEPIGIPGVPDAVPPVTELIKVPPTACNQPPARGGEPRLIVAGGYELRSRPLDGAVLVAGPGRDGTYVVWQGTRFRVTDRSVPPALGLTGRPVPVTRTWLNTLARGADLAPPGVAGRGEDAFEAPGVGALRVGQVLALDSGSGQTRHLLATPGGAAPISAVAAALVMADPRSARAMGERGSEPLRVTAADVGAMPTAPPPDLPASWPVELPRAVELGPEDALCIEPDLDSVDISARLLSTIDATELALTVGSIRGADRDIIAISPGSALLAAQIGTTGEVGGESVLVMDGLRHRLPPEAITAFGYETGAIPVSAELLAGIAEGPDLDPVAARTPRPASAGP